MLAIARTLSSSKKLKHPLFLSLSILAQSLTNPSSSSSSSSLSQTLNPQPQSPIKPPPLNSFCYFSTIPSLPLTRDGNYDETTSHVVCPGCGVHMQDSDPKHPGFFLKPSEKSPSYRSRAHLLPVAHETEFPSSLKKGLLIDPETATKTENETETLSFEKPVVCTRCHSLRHYGKVKDPTVESLLPDFDFDYTIGRRLASTGGTRSVVLMVVDSADFDGSFPRKVAKLVSATIEENHKAWKEGKPANLPRMVLVVTKIDLLPSTVEPVRLERWVKQRARAGGAGKNMITSFHFVSAVKDWGLKNLVDDVVGLAGPRGCVWTVGAQNAGKSTLINALGKCLGGRIAHLTEAPVPGTTLGIVRVEGVLPGKTKLFDTPGLLHPNQITTRLSREEQTLVHIGKELKPRTYRIKAGHTIHIAGLMRLDIENSSVDSIYITVWASPYLPLHMGKTENAQTMLEKHFGRQLQPPIGENRVEELGKWVRRKFWVRGDSWDSSSVDIAASGLGWFAIGIKGKAVFGVWTYEGVDVVIRPALIPYRSNTFEDAGFTVSKIVSMADQASNKQRQDAKRKQSNPKASVLAESPLLTVDADSNSC